MESTSKSPRLTDKTLNVPSAAHLEYRGVVSASCPQRIHAFDGLRALMMLLGVVVHTLATYTTIPLGDAWGFKDPQTNFACDVGLAGLHSFRMPVFFVLAGFFAALLVARRGLDRFVRNRATRVLVPFVLGYGLLLPLVEWGFFYANQRSLGAATSWVGSFAVARDALFRGDTGHLWFLYYLLCYYALSLLACKVVPRAFAARCHALFARCMASRWGILPFAAVVGSACAFMSSGVLETNTSLLPSPLVLFTYYIFYGFGWFLYGWREELRRLQTGLAIKAGLGFVLFALHSVCALEAIESGAVGVTPMSIASGFFGALLAWVAVLFWLGLALRGASTPKPLLRYLTDASYWIYLVHLPFAITFAGMLAPMAWPALLKVLCVFSATTLVSLLSYALFVRSTFISVLLNGRRYERRFGVEPSVV
jgi:glucan biosynthesis protein C